MMILVAGAGSGHLLSAEQRQPGPAGASWIVAVQSWLARANHPSRAGCVLLCWNPLPCNTSSSHTYIITHMKAVASGRDPVDDVAAMSQDSDAADDV